MGHVKPRILGVFSFQLPFLVLLFAFYPLLISVCFNFISHADLESLLEKILHNSSSYEELQFNPKSAFLLSTLRMGCRKDDLKRSYDLSGKGSEDKYLKNMFYWKAWCKQILSQKRSDLQLDTITTLCLKAKCLLLKGSTGVYRSWNPGVDKVAILPWSQDTFDGKE